jgi:hypothetical protein
MKRKLSEHRKKRASSAANHIRDQTQKLPREIMKQKQRQRANASRLQMEHKPDEPQSTLTALQDKKTSFSFKSLCPSLDSQHGGQGDSGWVQQSASQHGI